MSEQQGSKTQGRAGQDWFARFASAASRCLGAKWAFAAAIFAVLAWIVSGPLFHFSNTWQLVINTGTTIVTFLMVFLIQNTQNRDAKAINLKLDELIKASKRAGDHMVNVESASDEHMDALQEHYGNIRKNNTSE